MKRTISVMIGKGCLNHNERKFHAKNTDPERTYLNQTYCNERIQNVYHELFDDAVKRYNAKQKRSDRCISDYYRKIRTGKQEKPFHEVIIQIGNKDNTGVLTENGKVAVSALNEYMEDFKKRNPYLRVFSAHLHMDEATPHLHIDFVPFTTGSKRGLDSRVSLKQALAAQGFKGGSRQDTEWNQWVDAEKQQLALVMERHGIEWEKLGTHEKHLSVLNFEKQEREKEVVRLDDQIGKQLTDLQRLDTKQKSLQAGIGQTEKSLEVVQKKLNRLQKQESLVNLNVDRYDTEKKWQLPEPGALMSARSYKIKIVEPFISKLKDIIRSIVAQYLRLKGKTDDLENQLASANERLGTLNASFDRMAQETLTLRRTLVDYKRIRRAFGEQQADRLLEQAKKEERSRNIFSKTRRIDR
ncbi:MAG: plasmid recombination protein [Clostridia bacterium]|jgi:peptidoglycan hydrolase CwlO-like protein|nr:plasmid recombination protein [Clostridia bacterium]MCI2013627.1 plasmid recombination protein [Clostridia bacterium]